MRFFPAIFFLLFAVLLSGCGVYKFNDVSIPANVKTIKLNFIENVSTYVNPQLSPNLTDRLRQKINNQTKLSLTNSDEANWILGGQITDYVWSTVGVTSVDGKSQVSINRLTVTVKMNITRKIDGKEPEEVVASRQFDFSASQSIQQAEAKLLDEMVRNLTDEIFNRVFSKW